jgi:hypothetical protein
MMPSRAKGLSSTSKCSDDGAFLEATAKAGGRSEGDELFPRTFAFISAAAHPGPNGIETDRA